MDVSVYDLEGKAVEVAQVREDVFGITPNWPVVHQAFERQRANARQGTASTKTRGQVVGSTAKLFRQKGTGRARQGGIRAPHRRGGGVVFGPHPRSYRQDLPRKMRRLAVKSVLAAKLSQDELRVVKELALQHPRTKDMLEILKAFEMDTSVLIVTEGPDSNAIRSSHNIPGVKTLPAALVNVGDLFTRRHVLMTLAALRQVEAMLSTPIDRRPRALKRAVAGVAGNG